MRRLVLASVLCLAVDGGAVVDRMREGKGRMGFDAASKQYVDLVEAGIIDPTKVPAPALG